MSADNNRRDFLKKMAVIVPATLIGQRLLFTSQNAFAQAGGPMVSEKDAQAVSLGYRADASKVDTKKFPKRAGADGAKQFCSGCMFYQGGTDPLKTKTAPCQLFPGKQVSSKGWCNSWTKNPKLADLAVGAKPKA